MDYRMGAPPIMVKVISGSNDRIPARVFYSMLTDEEYGSSQRILRV